MSAFIVDRKHIDALVASGLNRGPYGPLRWAHGDDRGELTRETADKVGAMLWAENVASVEHRYEHVVAAGEDLPGSYQLELVVDGVAPVEVPQWWSDYRFDRTHAPRLSPVAALKAIDCYEYQSCEHSDWEESEAFAFCDALRRSLIGDLDGYDAAPWGIS